MSEVLRRKVAARTFLPLPFQQPHPPPPSMQPMQADDNPAAKRQRVETPISAAVDVALASQRIDSVPTDSPSSWVVVASSSSATVVSLAETTKEEEKPTETTTRRTGKWSAEEDAKLIEAVKKHENDFVAIAKLVPNRDHAQCHSRWTKSLKPSHRKTVRMGRWTAEEDAKLTEAVSIAGKRWVAVASFIPGRTNCQCNSRWVKNLELRYRKAVSWMAQAPAPPQQHQPPPEEPPEPQPNGVCSTNLPII